MLPESLDAPLRRQLGRVRSVFESDRARSLPGAAMPPALERKYPSAPLERAWQFVFPARGLCTSPYSGRLVRYQLLPDSLQRAVKRAVRAAGIFKPASCPTFRAFLVPDLDMVTSVDLSAVPLTKEISAQP